MLQLITWQGAGKELVYKDLRFLRVNSSRSQTKAAITEGINRMSMVQ